MSAARRHSSTNIAIITAVFVVCFCHFMPAQSSSSLSSASDFNVLKSAVRMNLLYSSFIGGSASSFEVIHASAVDHSGNIYFVGLTESRDFPIVGNAVQTVHKGYTDGVIVKFNPRNYSIIYSTYLGGSGFDDINAIAVAENDDIILTGITYSGDFPVTPGSYSTRYKGKYDGFVTRIDSSGRNIVFSTYIGGSDSDYPIDIILMGNGNFCISGDGRSTNFPTTSNAWKRYNTGDNDDGFVSVLSSDGSRLLYSTYVGGTFTDYVLKCQVGRSLYVYGSTRSGDFPTTDNAAKRAMGGDQDIFLVVFDTADYHVEYSSFIGGSGIDDTGFGWMALDEPGGSIYLAGETTSDDLPVTPGAFMTTRPSIGSGSIDVVLMKIDIKTYDISACTYFGSFREDYASKILRIGPYIGLSVSTVGSSLPTTSEALRSQNTTSPRYLDGYFMIMDTSFSSLIYGSLIGGEKNDGSNFIAVDPSRVYLFSRSESKDFPITENAFQKTQNGEGDMYIMVLQFSDLSAGDYLPSLSESPRIVSLSPNPATDMVRLELFSPGQSPANTKLYALDGKVVRNFGISFLRTGPNIVTYQLPALPPGEYILSVETPRNTCVKRFVKY